LVLWGRGQSHKGPAIRALLEGTARLSIERLPAYAPEHNPVEMVWSYLKYGKLPNFVARDAAELEAAVAEHLDAAGCSSALLRRVWQGSGATLTPRTFPCIGVRTSRSKIITATHSFISGSLATLSPQINHLLGQRHTTSPQ